MRDFDDLNRTLARLRRDRLWPPLRREEFDPDPLRQFAAWFQRALAAEPALPNAMALATATPDGRPSVRLVLLKGFGARGFEFYTHGQSRKARELAQNPRAALAFYWSELHRQVRLEGEVWPLGRATAKGYFDSRPAPSRLAALLSPQSQVIPNRRYLEERLTGLKEEYRGRESDIPLPEDWAGYRLRPQLYEFWQHHPHRLHDRFRYARRPDGSWQLDRLAP